MEEILIEDNLSSSRPSLEQLTALVDFMCKHPDLATAKLRNDGFSRQKAKKLWTQLTNIANDIQGAKKTTQSWVRFWNDKKCMVKSKKKQVDLGKHSSILTPLEEKIWNLCFQTSNGVTPSKRKKTVKQEYSDESSSDDVPIKRAKTASFDFTEQPMPDVDDSHMALMDKLVKVMDHQASSLSQLAQATYNNAQAMERIADASQIQARAIERLASTFENIGAAVHDVRNAIINIDYTMKRCYTINPT